MDLPLLPVPPHWLHVHVNRARGYAGEFVRTYIAFSAAPRV